MPKVDDLVRHPTFGLGRIMGLNESKATVFFRDLEDRPLRTISTVHVSLTPVRERDPWLENLDRRVVESDRLEVFVTHDQAVAKFLKAFPRGFSDPDYLKRERSYKVRAHELWRELLNEQRLQVLLKRRDHAEICRRALRVDQSIGKPMLSKFEKAALREALREPAAQESFAVALLELVYGRSDDRSRFESFAGCLAHLPHRKGSPFTWPVQTIFPFLAEPRRFPFLKPDVTKAAAERRAFALNYRSEPNWLTYAAFLRFTEILWADLEELHPVDFIDVQSFIWATGSYV